MMILNSLYHREKLGNWNDQIGAFSEIVENFDCIQDDGHMIHSAIDNSAVPPVSCAFCKVPGFEHILAVADEDGSLRILNTEKHGIFSNQEHWLAHRNAIFDIAWLESEPQILTASGDQTAVLWNIETVTKLATFRGHSCSLKAVSCIRDNKFIFATCARDGNIMIWDTRCNKRVSEGDSCTPVDVIRSAHINTSASTPRQRKKTRLCNTKPANDSQQSVTAIIFQDEHSLISAGAMDGAIKIWDLRKNYNRNKAPTPRHVFPYAGSSIRKRGFSNLLLDSTSSRMFASCTDNIIYQYDCAGISTAPVAQYTGHLHSSFYVKASLSPNDEFLLSGSSDDNGYIWQVGKSEKPLYQLQGHANEVTSVAWNRKDFFKLVTCSDDNTVKVWRLNKRAEPLPINERSGWCTKYRSTGASAESTVSNHANGNAGSNDVTVIQTSIPLMRADSDSQPMTMRPLSPLLARSAPTSPISSIPNTAATLPVTPPQCNMNRQYVSPKLRDSSIKKWLNRKQLVKQGTLKKSPRKSPVKEKENVSGSADDGNLRGVKRKIEDDERFSRENKVKVCEETTFNTGDLQPLEQHFVMEPEEKDVQKLSEINVNVESNDVVTASPKTDKVRNTKGDESFCRSPTINLPNLVLDSPKKASGQQQLNCQGEIKKKQTNWLSQLTRQKKLLNSEDVVSSKQTSPSNGKNSPKLTKVMRGSNKDSMSTGSRRPLSPKMPQPTTPTSPKSPNTRCIRHYFQPVSSRNEVQK